MAQGENRMALQAFIIRPFGEKENRSGVKINFDKVEELLIAPALAQLGIDGGTTGEIVRAGNIREDMFQLLLTADLVIADLSIDNANVFYELGIRQALRDKWTVLLRCKTAQDKYPFDLSTDRYLEYSETDPAASLDSLIRTMTETLSGDVTDSPVFKLLPGLTAPDPGDFLAVPADFHQEVQRAIRSKSTGDLEVLADEASGFSWEREGVRLVGRGQLQLRAYKGALRSWESVRRLAPDDLEAAQSLATIYQRLNRLDDSDQAVDRALGLPGLSAAARAEQRALRASNEKARWRADWDAAPAEERRARALRSPYLGKALAEYGDAFEEDLNHYYAGINALAMCVIQARLAEALPEVWAEKYETDDEANRDLDVLRKRIEKLTAAVELSVRAARKRKPEIWIEMTEAARVLLTATRPARVAAVYREALVDAAPFVADSERRQLQLYESLGILKENVESALSALPAAGRTQELRKQRILLFAGHMLDAPGRPTPRFPADKEEVAREEIRRALLELKAAPGGISYGIAGGANGGDLLFHEVCHELGIKTELWLALPPEEYIRIVVQPYVGKETETLVPRFNRVRELTGTPTIMADAMTLPRWLQARRDYDFWQRHTKWMIYSALNKVDLENLSLLALWDGEETSGTYEFVRTFRDRSGSIRLLSTKALFRL